jgi:hypothetical protein
VGRTVARASLVILSVLVLATACGGSSKKKSSAPATTTTASASTTTGTVTRSRPATTSSNTAPARPRGAVTGFASPGHCAVLRSLGAKISQSVPTTFSVSKTDVVAETAALRALANAAPAEIRGDFRTYVDAFGRYMGAYASIGLRRGAVPTHAQYVRITKAATAAINTPGLAGAEQRLKHWVRAHCPKVPKKR